MSQLKNKINFLKVRDEIPQLKNKMIKIINFLKVKNETFQLKNRGTKNANLRK